MLTVVALVRVDYFIITIPISHLANADPMCEKNEVDEQGRSGKMFMEMIKLNKTDRKWTNAYLKLCYLKLLVSSYAYDIPFILVGRSFTFCLNV